MVSVDVELSGVAGDESTFFNTEGVVVHAAILVKLSSNAAFAS